MPRAAPVRAARPHPASAAARVAADPAPALPATEEVLVPFNCRLPPTSGGRSSGTPPSTTSASRTSSQTHCGPISATTKRTDKKERRDRKCKSRTYEPQRELSWYELGAGGGLYLLTPGQGPHGRGPGCGAAPRACWVARQGTAAAVSSWAKG